MKYFTMEELDDITRELIENPSRETLKKLNDKYNGVSDSNTKWVETNNNTLLEPSQDTIVNDDLTKNNEVNALPKIEVPISNIPFWNPTNNAGSTLVNPNTEEKIEENKDKVNIPFLNEAPLDNPQIQVEQLNNKNVVPSLEVPKLETFAPNNNVPFNGNLWEPQNNMVNDMMQTTDNFNRTIEQMPNSQPVSNQNPFFETGKSPVNNPIPVMEPPVMEGPTMFGQFEQDFNNNAA